LANLSYFENVTKMKIKLLNPAQRKRAKR
jgi:hypothetical protein